MLSYRFDLLSTAVLGVVVDLRAQSAKVSQLDIVTAAVEYSTDTVKKSIAAFALNIRNALDDLKKAMVKKCI